MNKDELVKAGLSMDRYREKRMSRVVCPWLLMPGADFQRRGGSSFFCWLNVGYRRYATTSNCPTGRSDTHYPALAVRGIPIHDDQTKQA